MKYARILPVAFLLASTAFSQNPGKRLSDSVIFNSPAGSGSNCPVEIKAKLDVAAKVLPVEEGQTQKDERQFHITLGNPKSLKVVTAKITLHGFPVGVRLSPAVLYLPDDPAEIKQTVVFDRTVASGANASMNFGLHGFSTVTAVDLDSVTYSDGSQWHPENHQSCRAVSSLPIDAVANSR